MFVNEPALDAERQAQQRWMEEPFNTVHLYLAYDKAPGPEVVRRWFELGWPALGDELAKWFDSDTERERLRSDMPGGAMAELFAESGFQASEGRFDDDQTPTPSSHHFTDENLDAAQWSSFLGRVEAATQASLGAGQLVREPDGFAHRGNNDEVVRGIDLTFDSDPSGWTVLKAVARWEFLVSPQRQDNTLAFLQSVAEASNPSYGEISHSILGTSYTALEYALGQPSSGHLSDLMLAGRRTLRGYGWITIIPAELTARLDPIEVLAKSDAFRDVRELSGGGLWLQATPLFADYDQDAAERVAKALAPILPRGMPHPSLAKQAVIAELDTTQLQ